MRIIFTCCLVSVTGVAGEVPSPAAVSSGGPNLHRGADGQLYLSWIERGPQKLATLRFSKWKHDRWTASRRIASGKNWFVNWADFPSLCSLGDGTLVAHWLQKSSSGTYSYDVKLSRSRDQGQSWSPPVSPHRDGTPTEHGFVSIVAIDQRTFGVFWLDGRKMVKPRGEMALRFCTLTRDGRLGAEQVIDPRVCECCQTGAVALSGGSPLVVYRDRSSREVRDIGAATLQADRVVRSGPVYADNWMIDGCPVNGPSLDVLNDTIVVAWYTQREKTSRIQVRFSRDSGRSYGQLIRVDHGHAAGRVDVVLLDQNTAVVSWLRTAGQSADIRWRVVSRDGTSRPSQQLATTRASRASGFPRVERYRGRLFFAWTDAVGPARVRTAHLVP